MSGRATLVTRDTIPIVRIRCLRQEDRTAFDLTNAQSAKLNYWLESAPSTVRQKQLAIETPLTNGFVRFQQQVDDFPDVGMNLYQVEVTDTAGGIITGIGSSVLEIVAKQ